LDGFRPSAVYAVENPSIFAVLVDRAVGLQKDESQASFVLPILICTNGQPSVAVIRMLELLLGEETAGRPFYYSGDLDVKGLDIAHGLQQRLKPYFYPWKMNGEHYVRYAKNGISLTEAERERIRLTGCPWDATLAQEMANRGAKLHQELWVEELAVDWTSAFLA
jgi:uncharacterized protein (TIGR02679 family)